MLVFCYQVSKAACILTTQHLMRTLRSKEAAAAVNIKTWPTIIDTGKKTKDKWHHQSELEPYFNAESISAVQSLMTNS